MQKIRIIFILALCMLVSSTGVWANSDNGKIEISFKTGDEILNINGEEVKVEKPFITNGTTLVPVRVITESFGSKVDWNGEDRRVTLSYEDIVIKLTIDSKEAIVNGTTESMLEAPVIVNNTTMVPLRFITENFGAEVTYNNETSQIVVTKELTQNDGIQDFSQILKKTSDEMVGDSYYKWSLALPQNVKLSYRNFSGTYNEFEEYDGTYYVYVNITEASNSDTMNSLLAEQLQYVSSYTLVNQGIFTQGDQEYVKVVYKDGEWTYEDRMFIKDDKVFIFSIEVKGEDQYKNNNEIASLLDSFKTEFVDNESIKNLSNVVEDGYRAYENEKLKWSINILADWQELIYGDKVNEVRFAEEYNLTDLGINRVVVKMTSKKDGLTLDEWIANEEKNYEENYNDELVKILKTKKTEINGKKSVKLYTSMELDDKVIYSCEAYLIGENYKYQVLYVMNSNSYKDSEIKSKIEKMIDSFDFEEPVVEEVGQIIDVNEIVIEDGTREIKNEELKWAFEIPYNWTADYENNDKDAVSYSLSKHYMGMKLDVDENVSSEEYKLLLEQLDDAIEKMANSPIDVKEFKDYDIKDKGTTIKKLKYKLVSEDFVYNITNYVFRKNGNVYRLTFGIADVTSSEKNEKIIEDIWESFEFE